MAKIHDNGGVIGKTLDFNSTDTYTTGSTNKKNSGIWSLASAVPSAPPASYDSIQLDYSGNEGSDIRWVLNYTDVPIGTTVGYTLSGTGITATDFQTTSLTGTITLNAGTGQSVFSAYPYADQLSEGNETITVTLDATDSAGNPTGSLTNSDAVIFDTSRAISYGLNFVSDSTPNEGSQFYIEWAALNTNPGTMYWSINGTTSDFDVTSGSMSLWSGPTTIGQDVYRYYRTYITPTADSLTEGNEVYTVTLRTESTSGTVRAAHDIIVQDTSKTVSYSYFSGPSSIDEGSSGTFEFRVANSGEPMFYTISPAYASDMASANPGDGGQPVYLGTTTIGNDTFYRHQVTLNAVADTTTEGAEAYTLYFRSGGDVGPIRAQASFTINDTSTTPAASSGSELSAVLMTRSGQYTTNSWEQNVTVDLSPYVGSTGRLVFYYETTTSFTADIQLDNVNLNGTTYNFNSTNDGFETTIADTNSAGLETTAHYESLSFIGVPNGTSGYRWNRDAGGTGSSGTGLTFDADGSSAGFYLYPETSVSHPASYWLRSPEVTLTTGTCNMAIARYGSAMGTIKAYWYGTPAGYRGISDPLQYVWKASSSNFISGNTLHDGAPSSYTGTWLSNSTLTATSYTNSSGLTKYYYPMPSSASLRPSTNTSDGTTIFNNGGFTHFMVLFPSHSLSGWSRPWNYWGLAPNSVDTWGSLDQYDGPLYFMNNSNDYFQVRRPSNGTSNGDYGYTQTFLDSATAPVAIVTVFRSDGTCKYWMRQTGQADKNNISISFSGTQGYGIKSGTNNAIPVYADSQYFNKPNFAGFMEAGFFNAPITDTDAQALADNLATEYC